MFLALQQAAYVPSPWQPRLGGDSVTRCTDRETAWVCRLAFYEWDVYVLALDNRSCCKPRVCNDTTCLMCYSCSDKDKEKVHATFTS